MGRLEAELEAAAARPLAEIEPVAAVDLRSEIEIVEGAEPPCTAEAPMISTGTTCKDDFSGCGEEVQRVYSGSLLLAQREIALRALATGPPGLPPPPGLSPMWRTEPIPEQKPAAKSKKAEKRSSEQRPKAKAKAASKSATSGAAGAGAPSTQILESDFHCKPRGIWASKAAASVAA